MSSQTINSLFQDAADDGDLSGKSMQILTGPQFGAQMQAAMGLPAVQIDIADDVIIVATMIDDSGSVSSHVPAIIDGHNLIIDSLAGSKQAGSIMMSTSLMVEAHDGAASGNHDAGILFPFVGVQNATRMSNSNYHANGWHTPLYDQSLVVLGSVLAKTQDFSRQGVAARSVTLLVTDGEDNASRHSVSDVRAVVEDMIRAEKHIVAFLGIGNESKFRRIAADMGIPDQWVMTSKAGASEIRAAFRMFSQSAVRASQNAMSFSQSAGGFWNT